MSEQLGQTYAQPASLGGVSQAINGIMQTIDAVAGAILAIPLIPLKLLLLSFAWTYPLVDIIDSIFQPFAHFGT